jgi:hypothetical protein
MKAFVSRSLSYIAPARLVPERMSTGAVMGMMGEGDSTMVCCCDDAGLKPTASAFLGPILHPGTEVDGPTGGKIDTPSPTGLPLGVSGKLGKSQVISVFTALGKAKESISGELGGLTGFHIDAE